MNAHACDCAYFYNRPRHSMTTTEITNSIKLVRRTASEIKTAHKLLQSHLNKFPSHSPKWQTLTEQTCTDQTHTVWGTTGRTRPTLIPKTMLHNWPNSDPNAALSLQFSLATHGKRCACAENLSFWLQMAPRSGDVCQGTPNTPMTSSRHFDVAKKFWFYEYA
jgi:hypothetical protein